ncbi:tRNA lysidine(34) synthetase TilS [Undibacterium umbellatum]|uniref:tRNA(Ile)-lysidine synthase n=1 Tax=Undibacterium umbellatum TaxID=2762300 RepID=A0ABR6Z4X6_9BURK|nr:tRNA lysidine(34) synthetase TilS [Undibacterium umbellatum]MBC3906400.1 tRNA lysidine(34) synthetase TilS [Undibacterium umbellatum]
MRSDQHCSGLEQTFSKKLDAIIADFCEGKLQNGVAVAYSGGLDSTVLLSLAMNYCRRSDIPLFAFHVHHGLSSNADAWLEHCRASCVAAGISFQSECIQVSRDSGDGVEASARKGRYLALGRMSKNTGTPLILAAHHQDDQAETLLLQLLRGSGVAGMSGMDVCHRAPNLFGHDEVMLGRPLLTEKRSTLEAYASQQGLNYIEDESNTDQRYLRNAIRHSVMPVLEALSPGYSERIARSATHFQAAQDLLLEVAQQDFVNCTYETGLAIAAMRALSPARRDNLFRYWFSRAGVRMPTTSRLQEMQSQLFDGREDARITVHHDTIAIHRYKDTVYLSDQQAEVAEEGRLQEFVWQGQAYIHFPEFAGSLYFDQSVHGLEASWLQSQALSLHLRRGGERLKLAENRSTRDMKSHFQSLRIPFWQRERLPYVSIGQDLLFAAGVGMQSRFCQAAPGACISLRWVFD